MTADVLRLRLLLVFFAGWINRHQQELIEYLIEENRVPREQVKGRRLRLTDDQRHRLAAKGHRIEVEESWSSSMGHAQAIVIDRTQGILAGGADPRGDGLALGW